MARTLSEIEQEVLQLNMKDRAELARNIIDHLDAVTDGDVEHLWLEEAQRRYQTYLSGESEARPAHEVFRKARQRLRQ